METLFDKFGGIRPMADHLSEAPSTVQSWKTAGRVPAAHQPRVLAKANALGLDVAAEDVVFPLGREGGADQAAHAVDDGRESDVRSSGESNDFTAQAAA